MKENQLKLSQICSYRIFFKGLKDEFETAVVNESSVFEPVKFYCIFICTKKNISAIAAMHDSHSTVWSKSVFRPVLVRFGKCTFQVVTNEKQRKT